METWAGTEKNIIFKDISIETLNKFSGLLSIPRDGIGLMLMKL